MCCENNAAQVNPKVSGVQESPLGAQCGFGFAETGEKRHDCVEDKDERTRDERTESRGMQSLSSPPNSSDFF